MVKIYIDPGHGGSDPGAVGNGLKEKDLNLKIALKVRDILNQEYEGHEIKLSRTKDETKSLSARTKEANAWGADYFLSIHINAGGGTGFESFIYNGNYSNKRETDRLRGIIHDTIMDEVDFNDRGEKEANFHVLRETSMSASLTENGFIDHPNDAKKLKSDAYLNRIAKGHAVGLAKAFNLKKKESKKETTETNVLYKVQVGAFVNKSNAERLADELNKKGYSTYIVKEKK